MSKKTHDWTLKKAHPQGIEVAEKIMKCGKMHLNNELIFKKSGRDFFRMVMTHNPAKYGLPTLKYT